MTERNSGASPNRHLRLVGPRGGFGFGLLSLAWLGCGGGALDSVRVREVNTAMRAADELRANDPPRAALHLARAPDEAGNTPAADASEEANGSSSNEEPHEMKAL